MRGGEEGGTWATGAATDLHCTPTGGKERVHARVELRGGRHAQRALHSVRLEPDEVEAAPQLRHVEGQVRVPHARAAVDGAREDEGLYLLNGGELAVPPRLGRVRRGDAPQHAPDQVLVRREEDELREGAANVSPKEAGYI